MRARAHTSSGSTGNSSRWSSPPLVLRCRWCSCTTSDALPEPAGFFSSKPWTATTCSMPARRAWRGAQAGALGRARAWPRPAWGGAQRLRTPEPVAMSMSRLLNMPVCTTQLRRFGEHLSERRPRDPGLAGPPRSTAPRAHQSIAPVPPRPPQTTPPQVGQSTHTWPSLLLPRAAAYCLHGCERRCAVDSRARAPLPRVDCLGQPPMMQQTRINKLKYYNNIARSWLYTVCSACSQV